VGCVWYLCGFCCVWLVGFSWLSRMRQTIMYPVCEDCLLGRAGRKPNSFFLFAVGREIFLAVARRCSDGILPLTDLSARQRGFHRVTMARIRGSRGLGWRWLCHEDS